jgi:hypothetical protein
VPPWFAEASRPQPQWSTPTQPRNGRRRPGPTPNSTGQRKHALPPAGLSPAAQECLSEGAQAAFAAIAALWTAQSASYSLHQRFWEDVRMWRGGYHGPRDVSRQILADSNVAGPQSDTPWMPNYGPGPLPILTLDSARYLTRLSTSPATCLGRASLGTPVVPVRPRVDSRFGC